MIRRSALLATMTFAVLAFAASSAEAAEVPCALTPTSQCFGIESVEDALSTKQVGAQPEQAGGHSDFSLDVGVEQDPESKTNAFGLKDSFGATRNIRFEVPPGLIGNPNVLGAGGQCKVSQLVNFTTEGCPNSSQVGISRISAYELKSIFLEPVYMMQPPGGDVVARLGTVAGIYPVFIDFRVRSEGDYGLTAEVSEAPAAASLVKLETTLWGVPAAAAHNSERCTSKQAFEGCLSSLNPPGGSPLPFLTNPTRCGVSEALKVRAASWIEPERLEEEANEAQTPFPTITGCNNLPFGPKLEVEPTSHRAAAPTGLDMTIKLPASDGVNVLEPSQTRSIKITLPRGLAVNTGSADGLETCSPGQVHFEERVASECPDGSKLADTEFDIPVLERKLKGAIYLREPEPGNPFRIWIVADDLGLHVKLPGQLHIDKETGQIESLVIGTPKTEGIPQAPLREVKLEFKSGFRAPLINPQACGTYTTEYEFVPWSGGPPAKGPATMNIDGGCNTGGFNPRLSAGSTNAQGGAYSPFVFTLTREDGEQNPSGLSVSLPAGFAAGFAGIPRCEGVAAQSGQCPRDSRIGKVVAAVGAGPAPLWVPQPGARPTAVYLSGPYKGAPTSIVAVVPKQAGPFDFGDEVVRSAVYVDPTTARATAKVDPLPQFTEGIPLYYRALNVQLDRPDFTLNPTSCAQKETEATITSPQGSVAHPASTFEAVNCAKLGFKPKLSLHLLGGTRRGSHPKLRAVLKARPGDANIAATSVALPHSEFLDQAHIKTVCTRVQFAAKECPAGSIYGHAEATTPLIEGPLSGPVYLRSSSHQLPDLVVALRGPDSLPIEIDLDGRVDSVNGGIRNTFEVVPDAPVSRFTLSMLGGKKGLLINSADLCAKTTRATVKFSGQNGRNYTQHPPMAASCGASK